MLSLPPAVRILLARGPAELRKGFDGLARVAESVPEGPVRRVARSPPLASTRRVPSGPGMPSARGGRRGAERRRWRREVPDPRCRVVAARGEEAPRGPERHALD